jgi:ATP-dependent helicase/DNAse subunit B
VEGALRANHLLLRADLLRLAAKRAKAWGTVWLDGFLEFSDPELDFIVALKRSANVKIAPEPLYPEPENLEVFRAASIDREVQAIAVRILKLECEFRDIAVVARHPSEYEEPLRSAFQRYGIPVRFYNAEPLFGTPTFRLNDTFVRMLATGWDQELLTGALRDAGYTGAIDKYDFTVRARMPRNGLDDLPEYLHARLASLEPLGREALKPADWPARFELIWQALELPPNAAMRAALSEAADLLGEDRLAIDEFWRRALPALRVAMSPDTDRRRNAVHFLSAYEARQWRLPVTFLCGLADGSFPRPWPASVFLPDTLRRSLRASGIRIRLPEDWDIEERQLFDSIRSNATQLAVMSYAGELASEFLDGMEIREVRCLPLPQPAPPPAMPQPELGGWYRERQSTLSVSGLEMFQECPFRYFAGRVLKLNPRPPRPEDRLDFLLRGTIVHETLARIGDVEQVFAETFEAHCRNAVVPEGYRKEYFRLQMLEDLRTFLRESNLPVCVRSLHEQQFNVPLAEGARLRGRIDRIDIREDGRALIIDYKYSRADRIRSLVQDDAGLQGPLYVLAAQKQWDLRVAGMYFCGVRRDPRFQHVTIAGWSVPGAEIVNRTGALTAEWVEQARGRAEQLAWRIQSGQVAPRPSDASLRARCEFRDVCRYEAVPRTAEAAG